MNHHLQLTRGMDLLSEIQLPTLTALAVSTFQLTPISLLHHYEFYPLFRLWRAETDGGRNIVAKAWGGRFPFQAKIALVTSDIIEVPLEVIDNFVVHPFTTRLDNVIEGQRTKSLIQALGDLTDIADLE
jgi:hypothetical protein